MVLVQGTRGDRRPRPRRQSRALRPRVGRRSCRSIGKLTPPAPVRRLLTWYYARIYIRVRPERIYVWPRGEISPAEPTLYDAHMEEVRSGHSEEPERFHADPRGGVSAWDHRITELGTRYPTAVLSIVSPGRVSVLGPRSGAPRRGGPLGPDRGRADGRAAAARSRLPDRPRPRRAVHLAAELPGPGRPGVLRGQTGYWSRAGSSAGSSSRRSRLALLRANAAKARRFRRTAKRELARRG